MPVRSKILSVIILILLALSSCLVVAVEKDSGRGEAALTRARERVLRLTANCSSSRPHRLKMLVYDPEEGQLVRISLPLWLVKKGFQEAFDPRDSDRDLDFEFEARAFRQALAEMPRGLVAEVWTDREKVLLWLE
ncbi:MAG: hypothetical protein NUW07_10040 [Candidatus Saccharicenans sp.]|nr:hypothetical protein [Candidatus Saccharicenans sp.]MDH7492283.1 hypothetical protein [Candidatus Saccharicenans sp.]